MPPHKVILHIDDDDDDREIVKEGLEAIDDNITVKEFSNGDAGLAYLKESSKTNELPCLVILDINMPGMGGKEVLNEIKKDPALAQVPVVLFTTSSSDLDKDFAESKGVQMITKPPRLNEVMEVIGRLLKKC